MSKISCIEYSVITHLQVEISGPLSLPSDELLFYRKGWLTAAEAVRSYRWNKNNTSLSSSYLYKFSNSKPYIMQASLSEHKCDLKVDN